MQFSLSIFRDFGIHLRLQNWLQKVSALVLARSWCSWMLFGCSWDVLGGSWGVLGPFPGDPEALLGRSWRMLGAFLERPGAFLRRFAGSLWFC